MDDLDNGQGKEEMDVPELRMPEDEGSSGQTSGGEEETSDIACLDPMMVGDFNRLLDAVGAWYRVKKENDDAVVRGLKGTRKMIKAEANLEQAWEQLSGTKPNVRG